MVKHIVFWKLKEAVTGDARPETLRAIKEGFEALPGKIPGLQRIEIGFPFGTGADSADLVLYSEFESRAALEGYDAHPLHKALAPLVRDLRTERRSADYET